jgi:cytidylate kinase
MIISIDGPAGSGKSSTARRVAERLNYTYIDSGAMYRAVALAIRRLGGLDHVKDIPALLKGLRITLEDTFGGQRVLMNGEDVSLEIRSPDVTGDVSAVSAVATVRSFLVAEQRVIAAKAAEEGRGVVMEGRDIGSVVFPDAELKIYLTASVAERARRRLAELLSRGHRLELDAVQVDLERRDAYDSGREHSPLTQPEGAILVDTTGLSIENQVDRIVELASEHMR